MSVQEIQSKIKGFLVSEKAYGVALILAIAGASFGAGRVSNLVSGDTVPPQNVRITQSASANLAIEPVETLSIASDTSTTKSEDSGGRELKTEPQSVPKATPKATVTEPAHPTDSRGTYVGSKNGTKYHLPWCSGAKNIKDENKVWFGSKEEAQSKGYTPAANCKGI